MQDLFPGYYRPTKPQIAEAWKTGLVVVDANVLLGLYRYPVDASEALFKALEALDGRIWLPHQAALEFQRNRLGVIAEQKARFGQVRSKVEGLLGSLSADLAQMQLKRRHSVIDPGRLEKELGAAVGEFVAELVAQERGKADVHEEDSVRVRIDAMFKNRVGPPFADQETLDRVYAEGEARFSRGTPPGYEDSKKASRPNAREFDHGGLTYQAQFGDLLLWKQVIAQAAERQITHLILVTDDEKADWWWREQSGGPKTIGPRPELVEEISRCAEVGVYVQYRSSSFLEAAREHLSIPVTEQAISKVEDVREADRVQAAAAANESGIQFTVDLMVPREEDCVFLISLLNNTPDDAGFRAWGAALQLEGHEYELRCSVPESDPEIAVSGRTSALPMSDRLDEVAAGIPPGASVSGWLVARWGRHVDAAMVKDPLARFHFTAGGPEKRFWSGPSFGPDGERRFLGPSVDPGVKFERTRFQEVKD